MTARSRVIVTGRVQGVFFRASCAVEARRVGVAGWVRNVPGGAVEAVFEGPDAAVAHMVAWSRRGPELAHVDEIEVLAEDPVGDVGFSVR
ncbi:MAG TPA: acylphosphatase [Actinomycetota bacterium]|nr:acylphosphatase [Actinomycetota bacterium]